MSTSKSYHECPICETREYIKLGKVIFRDIEMETDKCFKCGNFLITPEMMKRARNEER